MALFLSTYTNKVDKKGRISVPANFRATLANQNFQGIVAYASFINECIEACGMDRIEKINDSIDDLDPFSEERDAFATSILGSSMQLSFDGDGRITLPEQLVEGAKIKDKAVFVGKGSTFEIWQPGLFANYAEAAKALAQEKRSSLRLSRNNKDE